MRSFAYFLDLDPHLLSSHLCAHDDFFAQLRSWFHPLSKKDLRDPSKPIGNMPTLCSPNSLLETKKLASATNDKYPEDMTLSGNFRIFGSPLGTGIFADVHKVQSKVDERFYAVKRLATEFQSNSDRNMRLLEIQCMLELQEDLPPYLLRFFVAWQQEKRIHIMTELCCKDTCRQLFDTSTRPLPRPVVWKLLHDVASGLAHMHARNWIHNDIKPSNILFLADEEFGGVFKIADFGMARKAGSAVDGCEGDQKYMAKELLNDKTKLVASVDIFSLGLTVYESASKDLVVPSEGKLWQSLRNGTHKVHLTGNDGLKILIRSMMDSDPSKRAATNSILSQREVFEAGTSFCTFLAKYILAETALSGAEEDELQHPRNIFSLCTPPSTVGRVFSFCTPRA